MVANILTALEVVASRLEDSGGEMWVEFSDFRRTEAVHFVALIECLLALLFCFWKVKLGGFCLVGKG